MSAPFTPGPWFVEYDDQSGIGRTHAVYICTQLGWPDGQLARINVQDGLGVREANAHLISAAPDLLEAAEILASLDSGRGRTFPTVEQCAIARAAIAKATNTLPAAVSATAPSRSNSLPARQSPTNRAVFRGQKGSEL